MIEFNELKVSDSTLTIHVTVEDITAYSSVYLSQIIIDNQETYGTEEHIYSTTLTGNLKTKTLSITNDTTGFTGDVDKDLLIVSIVTTGIVATEKAVTYNHEIPSSVGLRYIKGENFSLGFTEFVLLKNALDLTIDSSHYTEAIKYWNYIVEISELPTIDECV